VHDVPLPCERTALLVCCEAAPLLAPQRLERILLKETRRSRSTSLAATAPLGGDRARRRLVSLPSSVMRA
jgi:hypothetical protein